MTDVKDRILKAYLNHVRKYKEHPTRADLAARGFSRDKVRNYFGSLTQLKEFVKENYPSICSKVVDESIFTPQQYERLLASVEGCKRFVVTTIVNGCSVNKRFLRSIKTYCKNNNAKLLLLPCYDPAHNLAGSKYTWKFDPILSNELIVFDNVSLNENLFISAIKLTAKQIDPTTGLARIGQRNGSFIYASPKQRLQMVATGRDSTCAIMTTGALTDSDYSSTRYLSQRSAYIANHDHVLGAIVVEVENEKKFHFRQIQANGNGNFIDLGKYYKGDCVEDITPEAIVLGDWHSGDTDPNVKKVFFNLIDELKPKTCILHDIFNAKSISHHLDKKCIEKAKLVDTNELSLEDEVKQVVNDLNEIQSHVKNVIIVKSNHDEHLEKYLEEVRYKKDALNHKFALKLAVQLSEENDPLKWAVENTGKLNTKSSIKWLQKGDIFTIGGVQLGAHGHSGPHGSRGSLRNMEIAYGNCIVGHYHVAQILRHAWSVGTCSKLELNYNRGDPSAWTHTSCLVYKNGSRQLINVIGNSCKLND